MLPCGKEDCSGCEYCKYDLPLDTPLKNINDMRNYGLMSVGDNPSTTQLIIPGAATRHHLLPVDESPSAPLQLQLPFNDESMDKLYCNNCSCFLKVQRPNKTTFNTRCTADTSRPGGNERVIKLNVYHDEKVKKPFWCPCIKDGIINSIGKDGVKIGPKTIYLDNVNKKSSLSANEPSEMFAEVKRKRELKDKWRNAPGLMAWGDIKVNATYHLPPTLDKNRMTLKIDNKYLTSIRAINIATNQPIWLYKDDEEYKYMSLAR